jgi:hypothetical protein
MSPFGRTRSRTRAALVGTLALLALVPIVAPRFGALEATSTSAPPPPPAPLDSPSDSASCRVAGSTLSDVPGGIQARLHNAGASAVTLRSLEWGWAGDAILTEIRGARDDGSDATLWSGEAASPTFLGLQTPIELAPGEGVDLSFVFKDLVPELGAVSSMVAAFEGGCLVVLVVQGPAGCDAAVSAPSFPPTAPFAVEFDIRNPVATPLELAAFRISWPLAVNGYLVALRIGGEEVGTFEPGLVGSPALLDLARLTGAPLIVPPLDSIAVRAVFERPVSNTERDYSIAVDEQAGCQASTTPDRSGGCGVQVLSFDPGRRSARLTLANLEDVTRTLEALTLYWPSAVTGAVREVRTEGGQVLWSGQADVSPAQLDLAPAPELRPRGRLELVLAMGGAALNDSEAGAYSGGAFTVVAHFGGECRAAFTTRGDGAGSCSLSAGELSASGTEASIMVENAGGPVRLERVGLAWPPANGALVQIGLDDDALWTGHEASRGFTTTIPANAPAGLGRSQTRTVKFGFEKEVASSPYAVNMGFVDADGASCPEILVSVRPRTSECLISLGAPVEVPGNYIAVPIDNAAAGAVALRLVEVSWPDAGVMRRAEIESPSGIRDTLFDGGAAQSPARLVPSSPVLLEPGTTQLLVEFAGPIGPADVSALVVADGCQARTGQGASGLPAVRQMNGWIGSLPESGLTGWWELAVFDQSGSTNRRVWVDAGTRFEPANIDPAVGDVVTVDVTEDVSGVDRALEIRFERAPFVEVRGTVLAISGDPPQAITVNGQTIHVADALVDGRLVVGAVVNLQGTQNPDGSITAMKVVVVDSRVGEFVEFRGVLQAAEVDPDAEGFQLWNVDGRQVRVDATLAGIADPEALPLLGTRVWVKGRFRDGLIRVVTGGDSASVLPGSALEEIRGVIVQLPADGVVGPWLIATDGGGSRRVVVPGTALVDQRVSDALSGARVFMVAEEVEETLTAVRVRIEAGP